MQHYAHSIWPECATNPKFRSTLRASEVVLRVCRVVLLLPSMFLRSTVLTYGPTHLINDTTVRPHLGGSTIRQTSTIRVRRPTVELAESVGPDGGSSLFPCHADRRFHHRQALQVNAPSCWHCMPDSSDIRCHDRIQQQQLRQRCHHSWLSLLDTGRWVHSRSDRK